MLRRALVLLGVLGPLLIAAPARAQSAEPTGDPDDEGGAWVIGEQAEPAAQDGAETPPASASPAVVAEPSAKPAPLAKDRPQSLPPVSGSAPPRGYVDAYEPSNLVIVGGTLIVSSFVLSIITGKLVADQTGKEDAFSLTLLPLAGPFAASAVNDLPDEARGLMLALGLVQSTALVMTVTGALQKKHVWQRKDEASIALSVGVSPAGATLRGAF